MTEEIIIDGIDVSECGFFHPEYDTDCHIALAFSEEYEGCMKCGCNPNCYFKQLKRAEQKLEKIKDFIYDKESCYKPGKCSKCLKKCQYQIVDKILQIIEGEENV